MVDHLDNLGIMTEKEKQFLGKFISKIPEKSIVIEVGTFLGGSAAIMSRANPEILIHSFDNYNDRHDRHKRNIDDLLHNVLGRNPRTIEAVSNILKNFKNIKLYKGTSPYDFYDWKDPIDVYFEDGFHKNPVLKDNVTFWKQFVKPNGYIIFHDHRPFLEKGHPSRFEDVIQLVEELSTSFYKVNSVDSLIVLQKK